MDRIKIKTWNKDWQEDEREWIDFGKTMDFSKATKFYWKMERKVIITPNARKWKQERYGALGGREGAGIGGGGEGGNRRRK